MKKFCPLMTIGFAPPATKNEHDNRLCKIDCAWYDKDMEDCAMILIKESLERLETNTSDILDNLYDYGTSYDPEV